MTIVAFVMVIAFLGGEALSLSRVWWKSAHSRSNMKPKSIPKQARKWIEELLGEFQVPRQHLMFPFHNDFCFIFLSFACIFPSFCIHVLPLSFHFPVMFLSCVLYGDSIISFHFHLIFLSRSFQCVHSCPFIFLSKVAEMALWLGQGTGATIGQGYG